MIDYLPSYYNGQIQLLNPKFPDKEFLFVYSDLAYEAKMIEMPSNRSLDIPYVSLRDMIEMYERNGWVKTTA